jgi:transmembrane sensor
MEQDLALLFKKLISNECSAEEVGEVLDRLLKNEQGNGHKLLQEHLAQKILDHEISAEVREKLDRNLKQILANTPPAPANHQPKIFTLLRYAAAACIILSLSIGVYLYIKKPGEQVNIARQAVSQPDLLPGSNKAILTLSNGKAISLTDAKNGILANEGKTAVQKSANGQLTYNAPHNTPDNKIATMSYNTVSTPNGGQYQLILPDGSKVWLNAASSLKFPTEFTGNDRSVELYGEAYFEVAKNKDKPFHVISNTQTIEVLGTHFNVNTYNDEPATKTTLLEGSVKVIRGNNVALLKPGQQASVKLSEPAEIKVNSNINTDEVVAWKNGKFYFTDTDIEEVMRQVGRWYDVDIEYKGKIPNKRLSGSCYRNLTASKALAILEYTGINFKIEGRKIIVQ